MLKAAEARLMMHSFASPFQLNQALSACAPAAQQQEHYSTGSLSHPPGRDKSTAGGWGSEESESPDWEEETHGALSEEEIVARPRRLLRQAQATETFTAALLFGQSAALHHRPDAAFFSEQEQQQLSRLSRLLPQHRTRPSLLLPLLRGGGFALGVATAVLPTRSRNAVLGAVQDALTVQYTGQLRELLELPPSQQASELKTALKHLRDAQRAPDPGPPSRPPPDIPADSPSTSHTPHIQTRQNTTAPWVSTADVTSPHQAVTSPHQADKFTDAQNTTAPRSHQNTTAPWVSTSDVTGPHQEGRFSAVAWAGRAGSRHTDEGATHWGDSDATHRQPGLGGVCEGTEKKERNDGVNEGTGPGGGNGSGNVLGVGRVLEALLGGKHDLQGVAKVAIVSTVAGISKLTSKV